ncbi:MAG: ABC transporter ATP-binding protein [Bradyrhizobiaceae bacterium]|nr:ABC transporter ATP-binding protein [Bradyrhizobiaceae bacterium]
MELSLNRIVHNFGSLTALSDVSIKVNEGEILALIGPSGCGKSTLLSIAGGILKPTSGEVVVRGSIPDASLNPITYVFQDFALLPWKSVSENVAFALKHHRLSAVEIERRVTNALERTGLKDFARAYPKQLSGGMRQRVGIARALAVSPAILLMDEPLSALDAQTRELLIEDILDLWRRDKPSIVYVTHNFQEALRLANRVCVLSRRPGRIKEIVEIEIPQQDRGRRDVQPRMAELGEHLWSNIRDEAIIADRELADV